MSKVSSKVSSSQRAQDICRRILPYLNGSSFQNAGRILSKVSLGSASPSAKLARILSSSSVSSGSASPSAPDPSSPSAAPSPSSAFGAPSASA